MSVEFENKDHSCLCQSKGFKKFVIVALGSFFGVFCALCLFCFLHKPYMMSHPMFTGANQGCCCHYHHHFNGMGMNNMKFYKELREYEQKALKRD